MAVEAKTPASSRGAQESQRLQEVAALDGPAIGEGGEAGPATLGDEILLVDAEGFDLPGGQIDS